MLTQQTVEVLAAYEANPGGKPAQNQVWSAVALDVH